MDEKHRMLYPPINASGAGSSTASPAASYAAVAAGPTAAEIKSATAEMGLPSEPPPTYDFAMASTSSVPPIATISAAVAPSTSSDNANWRASAPVNLPTEVILHQPHAYEANAYEPTLPMIVEQPGQPRYQTQLPPQQQYQQPQQTQYIQQQQQPQYAQQQQQQQQQQKPHYPDQQQYQQQPQFQQQQQQQLQPQQQTVTLPTTIITPPPNLGPAPCKVTCPACGTNKTTRMCWTPNSRTHLCALLLCLVGWCCCACCVPYCMTSCRTGNHFCAKCNTFLGTYNPNQRK